MSQENKVYNNILELIGNTPLIKLNTLTKDFPGSYFTKYDNHMMEYNNQLINALKKFLKSLN